MPLFWDLLWFVLFGIVVMLAGWLLRPRRGGGGNGRRGTMPAALALLTLVNGAGAALPPADTSTVVVVFGPGVTPAQAFAAVARADGKLVWSDPADAVWAIDLPRKAKTAELYRGGALLVSGALLPLGCVDWIRS